MRPTSQQLMQGMDDPRNNISKFLLQGSKNGYGSAAAAPLVAKGRQRDFTVGAGTLSPVQY